MNSAIGRLRSLLVSDVMTRDVVWLSEQQTLGQASKILLDHGISAAPVVDADHRCIGMLSSTDLWRREMSQSTQGNSTAPVWSDALRRGERVAAFMTHTVQSISPAEPLLKAAVIMCADHLHRLPVIDECDRLVGMVSTMDVVSALINAIEEEDGPLIAPRSQRSL
jgi:CBS-domain-containing membrane protein